MGYFSSEGEDPQVFLESMIKRIPGTEVTEVPKSTKTTDINSGQSQK